MRSYLHTPKRMELLEEKNWDVSENLFLWKFKSFAEILDNDKIEQLFNCLHKIFHENIYEVSIKMLINAIFYFFIRVHNIFTSRNSSRLLEIVP